MSRPRPPASVPLALLLLGGACTSREALDGPWTPAERELILSLSPLGPPPPSPGNAVADEPRAARLGQRLFFDEGLSRTGRLSCASCHQPERSFTDGRERAEGLRRLERHTPSVLGAAWFPFLNWDGARDSVWAQALGPLEDAGEMGMARTEVARHVWRAWRPQYEALFGPLPPLEDTGRFPPEATPREDAGEEARTAWAAMSEEDRDAVERVFANVGKALEAYQRRLVQGPSPFDRYVRALREGDEEGGGHLSPEARRGLRLFLGAGQCVSCHNGPLLSDRQFHNLGLPGGPEAASDEGRSRGARLVKEDRFRCGGPYSDTSRCDELRFLEPSFPDFLGAFRTPSLRNVARTAPYMHAGQLRTLEEVVAFYRSLPGQPAIGHRDLLLRRIPRTLPTRPLVAFLESLTGPPPPREWLEPEEDGGRAGDASVR
jgi:cytochrome c peroxidase